MLRNTIMIIAFLMIGSLHSSAQNDYYWSGGKQIFMDKTSTKKFAVVDSSITSISEFERVLDDKSLMVSGFFEKNVIPQINLRDSSYLDKNFAIIESKDSIKSDTLLNNSYIHYVSDYYQMGDNLIGTSIYFTSNSQICKICLFWTASPQEMLLMYWATFQILHPGLF
ncbi:MAG: hypothetical protein U9N51_02625 [Bacteroidota bacterium]|nr:hypothetical protein [Bacteroidota bacterium]